MRCWGSIRSRSALILHPKITVLSSFTHPSSLRCCYSNNPAVEKSMSYERVEWCVADLNNSEALRTTNMESLCYAGFRLHNFWLLWCQETCHTTHCFPTNHRLPSLTTCMMSSRSIIIICNLLLPVLQDLKLQLKTLQVDFAPGPFFHYRLILNIMWEIEIWKVSLLMLTSINTDWLIISSAWSDHSDHMLTSSVNTAIDVTQYSGLLHLLKWRMFLQCVYFCDVT